MNPIKQSAGRKGGSKCGPTKARHLSPDRAKAMAWKRWSKAKMGVLDVKTPKSTLQVDL